MHYRNLRHTKTVQMMVTWPRERCVLGPTNSLYSRYLVPTVAVQCIPEIAAASKQAQAPRLNQLSVQVALHRKNIPSAIVQENTAIIADPTMFPTL